MPWARSSTASGTRPTTATPSASNTPSSRSSTFSGRRRSTTTSGSSRPTRRDSRRSATRPTTPTASTTGSTRSAASERSARRRRSSTVELRQTYYTDARSSQNDQRLHSTYNTVAHATSRRSRCRCVPARHPAFNTTFRAEIDPQYPRVPDDLALATSYNWTTGRRATIGWTRRYFIEQVAGFNNPDLLDHYLNFDTRLSHRRQPLRRQLLVQLRRPADRVHAAAHQRLLQRAVLRHRLRVPAVQLLSRRRIVPADNRFFLSFTLAGLGNFSPFSGALGNIPR